MGTRRRSRRSRTTIVKIVVREYDGEKDSKGVEKVEKECEVGPSGKLSLYTDLLGDPICRIRHSPAFLMLVAEKVELELDNDNKIHLQREGEEEEEEAAEEEEGEEEEEETTSAENHNYSIASTIKKREIVGMIRGCIKTVTCGIKFPRLTKTSFAHHHDPYPPSPLPIYTKLAYILGLRVAPDHRRMGIGLKLVEKLESWFKQNGAEYSYLATESDNTPSLSLFTQKSGYSKFRTPSILVQPVYAHSLPVSPKITILKLNPTDAETLYRARFSTTEFFPRDIDSILNNPLSLGTFLAVPNKTGAWNDDGGGMAGFLSCPPESWAVLSVWNCKDLWRLQVRGASFVKKGFAKTTRLVDRALPWLKIPSVPEVFRPFGLHFLYGLGGDGPLGAKMVRALCGFAHNLAREHGCGVVATEVARDDPLRLGIPHWKRMSCDEDLWCIKRLGEDYSDGSVGDWTKSPPTDSIFVDPREF